MPIRSWFGRYYAKKYFLILVSYESRTNNHNIHVLGIYFCFVAFEIGRPARWRLWHIQKPGGKWCGGGRCGWLTVAKGLWNSYFGENGPKSPKPRNLSEQYWHFFLPLSFDTNTLILYLENFRGVLGCLLWCLVNVLGVTLYTWTRGRGSKWNFENTRK